jgi:hypothetical protein
MASLVMLQPVQGNAQDRERNDQER